MNIWVGLVKASSTLTWNWRFGREVERLMCGIFGIWKLDGDAVDLGKLQLATDAIRHRGPDDEGYLLVNTRAGLGDRNSAQSCGGPDTDSRLSLPNLDEFRSERFDLAFGLVEAFGLVSEGYGAVDALPGARKQLQTSHPAR